MNILSKVERKEYSWNVQSSTTFILFHKIKTLDCNLSAKTIREATDWRLLLLKDKSEVGAIDEKYYKSYIINILDDSVMNGLSYFTHYFVPSPCEISYFC